MPWDFAVAFVDGQLLEIKEKYAVRSSRGRPAHQDVAPEVELFFEACELIAERIRLEHEAAVDFLLDQRGTRNAR